MANTKPPASIHIDVAKILRRTQNAALPKTTLPIMPKPKAGSREALTRWIHPESQSRAISLAAEMGLPLNAVVSGAIDLYVILVHDAMKEGTYVIRHQHPNP